MIVSKGGHLSNPACGCVNAFEFFVMLLMNYFIIILSFIY